MSCHSVVPRHCAIYPAHSCSGIAITIRFLAPARQPCLGAGVLCPVPRTAPMPIGFANLLCRHGEASSHAGSQSPVCCCPRQSVRRFSQHSRATHCLKKAFEAPVASLLVAGLPATMLLRTRRKYWRRQAPEPHEGRNCARGRDLVTGGPSRAD